MLLLPDKLTSKIASRVDDLGRKALKKGVPPSWLGYRWIRSEDIGEYIDRERALGRSDVAYKKIHPAETFSNALPRNIKNRDVLPQERGWWHYSFWDVPERRSDPTFIATLPNCKIVSYFDDSDNEIFKDDFWVGILNRHEHALKLREFHFRKQHARVLRRATAKYTCKRATWLTERVYHNYSHWLTAHLPKFILLKERDELEDVLIPAQRPRFVDDSLRMVGIDPERFDTFQAGIPIEIEQLTLIGSDRFRPELLQSIRNSCPVEIPAQPQRRIYISRAKAGRRQLKNEDDIWPLLEKAGFEKVFMEELPFRAQVRLMTETSVLVAPHGAGLTNMLFCPPGTHVVEVANLHFPNPNFYAVAAAMDHQYWLLSAEPVGETHPLEKDLVIDPVRIEKLLDQL